MSEQDKIDLEKFRAFIATIIKPVDVPEGTEFLAGTRRYTGYSAVSRESGISNFLLERILKGETPKSKLPVTLEKIRTFNKKYIKG